MYSLFTHNLPLFLLTDFVQLGESNVMVESESRLICSDRETHLIHLYIFDDNNKGAL